MFQMKGEM